MIGLGYDLVYAKPIESIAPPMISSGHLKCYLQNMDLFDGVCVQVITLVCNFRFASFIKIIRVYILI